MAEHLGAEATSSVGRCQRDHEHEHGLTVYCYNNGCECDDCMEGMRRYNRWRRSREGRDTHVPAIGTERRLQALAWLGWPTNEIAVHLDRHPKYLSQVRNGDRKRISLSLAQAVTEFYNRHEMTRYIGPRAKHVRATAIKRGWVPPLAWNNIDNPNEQPRRVA